MMNQKRRLLKGASLALSLLLLLGSLAGCGGKPQEDTSGADGLTNTYMPPVNEDGYIIVTIPINLMGGQTPEEIIEDYQNDDIYVNSGDRPMTERITDVTVNEDGTVNYIFTPEQFTNYKADLYEIGRLKLVYGGEYPSSIIDAEYTDIDDGGVPWTVVVLIDQEAFAENYLVSMVFSTVWPATYLGKYQLFCGVPGDEWAVHVTVKDADSGEVISEHDFPTRDE